MKKKNTEEKEIEREDIKENIEGGDIKKENIEGGDIKKENIDIKIFNNFIIKESYNLYINKTDYESTRLINYLNNL